MISESVNTTPVAQIRADNTLASFHSNSRCRVNNRNIFGDSVFMCQITVQYRTFCVIQARLSFAMMQYVLAWRYFIIDIHVIGLVQEIHVKHSTYKQFHLQHKQKIINQTFVDYLGLMMLGRLAVQEIACSSLTLKAGLCLEPGFSAKSGTFTWLCH